MNVDEIKIILDLMQEHDVSELELEQDGVKLRLKKGGSVQMVPVRPPGAGGAEEEETPTVAGAGEAGAAGEGEAGAARTAEAGTGQATSGGPGGTSPGQSVGDDVSVVTSPIVGTFYRSAEPGAPPLVEVGDTVKKGQVLCIIEAMKLMNEIDSEFEGRLVDVFVENGQPVQYGERLFAIRSG